MYFRREGITIITLDGSKIAQVRADEQMTLREIAEHGKCSTRTIVKALSGEPIAELSAGRIAKALGVSVSELTADDNKGGD